jgi:hypothetical protein
VVGLRLSVVGTPRFVSDVRISPASVDSLAPGRSQVFNVVFNVLADAPAGQAETLSFRVTAEKGARVDPSRIDVSVEFKKASDQTAASAQPPGSPIGTPLLALPRAESQPQGPSAPVVLKLVKVANHSDNGEGTNAMGGLRRQGGEFSEAQFEEWLSVTLGAPKEIVAGQPFAVSAHLLKQMDYRDGSFCFPGEPRSDSNSPSIGLKIGLLGGTVAGDTGLSNYCKGNLKSTARSHVEASYYSHANSHRGGVKVTLTLTPDGVKTSKLAGRDVSEYSYRAEVSGDGNVREPPPSSSTVLVRQDYPTDARGYAVRKPAGWAGLIVELHVPSSTRRSSLSITLTYEPVTATDPVIDQPVAYEHPLALLRPLPESPASPAVASTKGGGGPGSGSVARAREPGAIDSENPDVARFIRVWLALAAPPANANGARLRYDDWGRVVGTGVNGEIITAGAAPGGTSPTAHLWALRDKLDSIDHCTLGEYVTARLGNLPTTRCAGRYQAAPAVAVAPAREPRAGEPTAAGGEVRAAIRPPEVETARLVPNVVGRNWKDAQNELERAGYRVELRGGDPSRQNPGSVQDQKPEPGQARGPIGTVTLRIHTAYSEPAPAAAAPASPPDTRREEELARECDALLRRGDNEYRSRRLSESLAAYRRAAELRCPAPNLPSAIAGVEQEIRQQNEQLRQRQSREAQQCNALLQQGDDAYNARRLGESLAAYRRASELRCPAPDLPGAIAGVEQEIRQQNQQARQREQQQTQQQEQRQQQEQERQRQALMCTILLQGGQAALQRGDRQAAVGALNQGAQSGCDVQPLRQGIVNLDRAAQQRQQQQQAQRCNDLIKPGNAAFFAGRLPEALGLYRKAQQEPGCDTQPLRDGIARVENQLRQTQSKPPPTCPRGQMWVPGNSPLMPEASRPYYPGGGCVNIPAGQTQSGPLPPPVGGGVQTSPARPTQGGPPPPSGGCRCPPGMVPYVSPGALGTGDIYCVWSGTAKAAAPCR